jgi:hypothetical protein
MTTPEGEPVTDRHLDPWVFQSRLDAQQFTVRASDPAGV